MLHFVEKFEYQRLVVAHSNLQLEMNTDSTKYLTRGKKKKKTNLCRSGRVTGATAKMKQILTSMSVQP